MDDWLLVAAQLDELEARLTALRTVLPSDRQSLECLEGAIAQAARAAKLVHARSNEPGDEDD